jgi:hypothetical protein
VRSASIAPHGGQYFSLEACLPLFDLLYERPACRGLLSSGGKSFAAAVVSASAALLVPPAARASHAPALAWLAGMAGERAEDVQAMAREVLRCVLVAPHEDAEDT